MAPLAAGLCPCQLFSMMMMLCCHVDVCGFDQAPSLMPPTPFLAMSVKSVKTLPISFTVVFPVVVSPCGNPCER